MDTMDILMDMGMDIMVEKHNNQNAKIGLERNPELSSSNFNQKINSTRLFKIKECQKYTAKFYNVSTYFTFVLFLLLLKHPFLVHRKHKLYNFSKRNTMQPKLKKKTQLKYELLTVKKCD